MQHGANFNKFNLKVLRKKEKKDFDRLNFDHVVKPPTEANIIVQRKQNIKAIELNRSITKNEGMSSQEQKWPLCFVMFCDLHGNHCYF